MILRLLILLLLAVPVKGQTLKHGEAFKAIGLLGTSVVLDAVSDGLYDKGDKVLSHTLEACSTGLLVMSPFLIKTDKWWWYAASYISFRIALFDPVYNITRGLPVNYIGNTSAWDKALKKFDPSDGFLFGRVVMLTFAVTITFEL